VDLAQVVKWSVAASLLLMVFALGLRATFADATSLFRDVFRPPHRLLRAVFAMNVAVPVVAVAVAMLFELPQAVRIALLAMAVSPVPPILPGRQLKAGGDPGFVYGLLVAVSIAAVVVVPASVEVLGWVFRREVHLAPDVVARPIAISILAPLFAGLVVRRLCPVAAARIAPWSARAGSILLLLGASFILFQAWPAIRSLLGSGAIIAFTGMALASLALGHAFGGADPRDRTVLGIASLQRHPGIALAIAHVNVPDNRLAPGAILLYLVISILVATVYASIRVRSLRRTAAQETSTGP